MQLFVVAQRKTGELFRDFQMYAAPDAQTAADMYVSGRVPANERVKELTVRTWRVPPAPGRVARHLSWAWGRHWESELAAIKTSHDLDL